MSRRTGRREAGNVTVLMLFFAAVLVSVCGLVLDAGGALNDRQRAADLAEQSARAGADQVVPGAGRARLDPARARAAALAYLDSAGVTGTVEVTPAEVTVTVTIEHPTRLLGAVGIDTMTLRGHATARPLPGVLAPDLPPGR